jgi:hypothetical protein
MSQEAHLNPSLQSFGSDLPTSRFAAGPAISSHQFTRKASINTPVLLIRNMLFRVTTLSLLLNIGNSAFLKANQADPGDPLWLAFGGCPGQLSPVGITAQVIMADPFLFMGLPTKPLDPKYLTSDFKHLNGNARDTFFCNASFWSAKFGLLNAIKGR